MARPKTRFVCQECGTYAIKWQGKCPECESWNSFVEETVTTSVDQPLIHNKPESLKKIQTDAGLKIITGIDEFDRVTGGGLVPGSIVLIGGPPGIGKSTLLLQIAQSIALQTKSVLYVSGEESSQQVKIRSMRLGIDSERIYLLPEINVESIISTIEKMKPSIVLIDSVQTLYKSDFSGAPGSVTQIRECTASLIRIGKSLGITIIIVGHVTKDGVIAGPRVLEHLVDTVLYFEGEDTGSFRILKSVKNRFGSTNEVGIFQMNSYGLTSLENPSTFFLSKRRDETPGSIIVPAIEGTRPILVEIQALVTRSYYGVSSRKAKGVDANRLALIIAVLEKRANLPLSVHDVYLNIVGGMEVEEPAIDLGIVIAIASSFYDISPGKRSVVFGEVGLGGEVRPVNQTVKRIQEAERLGFEQCSFPYYNLDGDEPGVKSIKLFPVYNIKEAIESTLGKVKKERR